MAEYREDGPDGINREDIESRSEGKTSHTEPFQTIGHDWMGTKMKESLGLGSATTYGTLCRT